MSSHFKRYLNMVEDIIGEDLEYDCQEFAFVRNSFKNGLPFEECADIVIEMVWERPE